MIGGEKRRSIVAAYVTKAFAEENSVDGGRKCVVGYDWLSVGVLGSRVMVPRDRGFSTAHAPGKENVGQWCF